MAIGPGKLFGGLGSGAQAPNNPNQTWVNPIVAAAGQAQGQGMQELNKNKADPRFRSFAERYVIARTEFFRNDPDGHAADLWTAMLNARRAYSLIRRMSQHLDPEDA